MKIVALLGSPRAGGNSAAIAHRFMATAAGLGAQTRTIALNRLSYTGCQACYACKTRLDRCILRDDLTEVLAAVQEADAVLMATPVYCGDVTSQLKGFIDRTFSYLVPDFLTNPRPSRLAAGKKLVFVVTQGNPDEEAFDDIFPRYGAILKRHGLADAQLLRSCGNGPASIDDVALARAEAMARAVVG